MVAVVLSYANHQFARIPMFLRGSQASHQNAVGNSRHDPAEHDEPSIGNQLGSSNRRMNSGAKLPTTMRNRATRRPSRCLRRLDDTSVTASMGHELAIAKPSKRLNLAAWSDMPLRSGTGSQPSDFG